MSSRRKRRAGPSERPSDVLQAAEPEQRDLPSFLNTSFMTHRLSPLHIGQQSAPDATSTSTTTSSAAADDDATTRPPPPPLLRLLPRPKLKALSRQLRDILVGDTVRGVYVGLEGRDEELGRAGPLERVTVDWVSVADILGSSGRDGGARAPSLELSSDAPTASGPGADVEGRHGLWVEISYENVVYEALLLPTLAADDDDDEDDGEQQTWGAAPGKGRDKKDGTGRGAGGGGRRFLKLPLLLTRMNASLRTVFLDWLSNEFDCRVGPLRLGTRSLVRTWERWIRDADVENDAGGKDLAVTLGFYSPTPVQEPPDDDADDLADLQAPDVHEDDDANANQPLALKTVDVVLPPADVRQFIAIGRAEKPGSNAGGHWDGSDHDRRLLAGVASGEEGWGWRKGTKAEARQPFTEALAGYLKGHLAMDLFHPSVRITRIACKGFVVTEGRIKVFGGEQRAIKNLLADLASTGMGSSIPKVF